MASFTAHQICETEESFKKWVDTELSRSPIRSMWPDELLPDYNPQSHDPQPVVQFSQSMNSLNSSSEISFNDSMVTPTPLQVPSQRQYSPILFGSQVIHSFDTQPKSPDSNNQEGQQPSTSRLQQPPVQAAMPMEVQETQQMPKQPLKKKRLFARQYSRK